jgi:hypothetical protein
LDETTKKVVDAKSSYEDYSIPPRTCAASIQKEQGDDKEDAKNKSSRDMEFLDEVVSSRNQSQQQKNQDDCSEGRTDSSTRVLSSTSNAAVRKDYDIKSTSADEQVHQFTSSSPPPSSSSTTTTTTNKEGKGIMQTKGVDSMPGKEVEEGILLSSDSTTRISIGGDITTTTTTTPPETSGEEHAHQSPERRTTSGGTMAKEENEKKRMSAACSQSPERSTSCKDGEGGGSTISSSIMGKDPQKSVDNNKAKKDDLLLVSSPSKSSKQGLFHDNGFFSNVHKSRTFIVTVNGTEKECNYEVRCFFHSTFVQLVILCLNKKRLVSSSFFCISVGRYRYRGKTTSKEKEGKRETEIAFFVRTASISSRTSSSTTRL